MLAHEEICFVCFLFLCLFFIVPFDYDNSNISPHNITDLTNVSNSDNIQVQRLQDAERRVFELSSPDGAKYGITKFSMMSQEEFRKKYLNLQAINFTASSSSRKKRSPAFQNVEGVPVKFDWRKKGYVTDIKTQYTCGACWAFASVGVLETMYAIKTGQLVDLSTQQVIDCAAGNLGCLGGDTCTAIKWMSSDGVRISNEEEYPLTLRTGFCRREGSNSGVKVAANYTCSNFVGKEEDIIKLLANHGPVAIAVDGLTWQDYLGGIIRFHCEGHLNHAAQIIGYDLTGPVPYYIIRNSWGPDFGINGYLHIEIGKNLCGVAVQVSAVDAWL